MLRRIAFTIVLGLLMYVPRPMPRPPIDLVPPNPDELPPGEDGPGGLPQVDPPEFNPIPLPEPEGRKRKPIRRVPHEPALPPSPPPGYEGEWPPPTHRHRPNVPPTPPPGHEGPWKPGVDGTFRDRIRQLIEALKELLGENPGERALADADSGAKQVTLGTPPPESTIEA